jgi:tetratricopeptide (TPR) repeat protein
MLKKIGFVLILLCGLNTYAQQHTDEDITDEKYADALALFHQKSYAASRYMFDELLKTNQDQLFKMEVAYYKTLTSYYLKLEQLDEEVDRFKAKYPKSIFNQQLEFYKATALFEDQDYSTALDLYDGIDPKSINKSELTHYYFNYAYSLFISGAIDKAKTNFEKARTDRLYDSKARFYLGYIAYEKNELTLAKSLFSDPFDDESLTVKSAYFKADISFRESNYQKAIEAALNYLPSATKSERSLLNKIVAESYFQMEDYSKAIPYYEAYKQLATNWSTLDSYHLGFCYFEQNDYQKAISIFNTIVGGNDELAQNAYYQLGACYMQLDKKSEALTAFRASFQLGYSKTLNEEAQYQYSKLSFDIGNPFEAAVSALGRFVTAFPRSSHLVEIKSLLIEAYVQTSDFEAALDMIEKQPQLASNTVLQQVTYLKAMDLIKLSAYETAIDYLDRSYSANSKSKLAARSLFWKAECLLELDRDQLALQELISLQKHPRRSAIEEVFEMDYLRAYAYFKMKRFKEAIPSFKKYLSNVKRSEPTYTDALLKLADSYYVSKDFNNAISTYGTVVLYPSAPRDYAAFKAAMSYGYLQQNNKKISLLKEWLNEYTTSSLRDEVSYNLAITYASEGQNDLAISTYDKLVLQHPQSPLVAVSKLRKGLLLYTKGLNTQALELFVDLTVDFPRTEEAVQGVAAAKRIYMEQGDLETYSNWVKGLDYISETEESLDKSSFDAAKQLLLASNTDRAIKAYEYYVETYPKGRYQLESRFDLAKLYLKTDLKNKALPLFTIVAKQASMFREEALVEKISLLIELNGLDSAVEDLKTLESIANRIQNEHFASSNLMRAYYQQKKVKLAKTYAKKLLAIDGLEKRLESDALLILARSSFELGELEESKSAYAIIAENASGETAAEALYFEAYFNNKDKDYQQSNEKIQQLAKDYPAYKEWAAKGLLLMAENFIGLEDAFQANYILSSVVKNFTQYPVIVNEASLLLKELDSSKENQESQIQKDSIQ